MSKKTLEELAALLERRRYYPDFSKFQAAGKTDRVSGGIDTK